MKFHCLVKQSDSRHAANARFLHAAVRHAIGYLLALMRSRLRTTGGDAAGDGGGRGVCRLHLHWLGLRAFVVVLRRKHTRCERVRSRCRDGALVIESETEGTQSSATCAPV
jgi:hypothetical protein